MRRQTRKDEGGSWMDTYGDMVTLLLCFFIMLYAISAVDQTKWMNLVKSLNPNSVETLEDEVKDAEEDMQDVNVPDDFETLYENLKLEVERNNLTNEIEVKKGAGFTFITFKSNIIFDGNSYVLKEEGKKVLDDFCMIIGGYSNDIEQIQVLGHTAVATTGGGNAITDRFLSSNRATTVLLYIQEKEILAPEKLVSMGYGQYRPISENDTEGGRAQNRRVEMLITKNDSQLKSLEEYYQEVY